MQGEEIKKYRLQKGLSRAELGQLVGKKPATIRDYENSRIKNIPKDVQKRLGYILIQMPAQAPEKQPGTQAISSQGLDEVIVSVEQLHQTVISSMPVEKQTAALAKALADNLRQYKGSADLRSKLTNELPKGTASYITFMLNAIYQKNNISTEWVFR